MFVQGWFTVYDSDFRVLIYALLTRSTFHVRRSPFNRLSSIEVFNEAPKILLYELLLKCKILGTITTPVHRGHNLCPRVPTHFLANFHDFGKLLLRVVTQPVTK